jgi:hypothetical protein
MHNAADYKSNNSLVSSQDSRLFSDSRTEQQAFIRLENGLVVIRKLKEEN